MSERINIPPLPQQLPGRTQQLLPHLQIQNQILRKHQYLLLLSLHPQGLLSFKNQTLRQTQKEISLPLLRTLNPTLRQNLLQNLVPRRLPPAPRLCHLHHCPHRHSCPHEIRILQSFAVGLHSLWGCGRVIYAFSGGHFEFYSCDGGGGFGSEIDET